MTFADGFMALTAIVGAAYFAYGVGHAIAARRAARRARVLELSALRLAQKCARLEI
jgi:hypothetical protein